ncbi:MAG: cytochrome c [Gemmatimonadota bacterium]
MNAPGSPRPDPRGLKHPFWQSVALLLGAYLLFSVGIARIPPLIGVASAPVPASVVVEFMAIALVGVLLYVSADEQRWTLFKAPIHSVMVEPSKRAIRIGLLIALPLLTGFLTYRQVSASVAAPPAFRSIHPAPPNEIRFRGQTIRLAGLENPLRAEGSMHGHLDTGRRLYVRNCMPCHGDRLDGDGHFSHAFNPVPADFTSNGTIAQLTESYVFWRVAKGGPGLPKEGTPWNSAMPAWETVLTQNEIWAVILYLYDQTGWTPRTWEHEEEGGDGGGH